MTLPVSKVHGSGLQLPAMQPCRPPFTTTLANRCQCLLALRGRRCSAHTSRHAGLSARRGCSSRPRWGFLLCCPGTAKTAMSLAGCSGCGEPSRRLPGLSSSSASYGRRLPASCKQRNRQCILKRTILFDMAAAQYQALPTSSHRTHVHVG